MDTLYYLLHEVHHVSELFQHERFSEFDAESVNLFLDSAKTFGDSALFPYIKEMDEKPVHFKDGKVIIHPQMGHVIKQAGEMGVIGSAFDYEMGGMQMPHTIANAGYYIMEAANNHAIGYIELIAGAAGLIATFGSEELKETYIPNMLTGVWGGTMCLTEPQAGSSLSDITTTAYPQPDGTYRIKGQKIWISAGDHEYVDNVIHLLLARIEGAPAGTKGISLFVVPKKRIEENGSLAGNDVVTFADFQKLGQRGYATTHLVFGDKEDCHGYLVGKAHHGLKYMFQMMNGARIAVGRQASAIACAAYHASLQYANERPQGRRLSNTGDKDLQQDQTLIINHPDVRRMLFLQKAIWEGSLSLILEASKYHDLENVLEGEERERAHLLLEMLTPMVKTYPAEAGRVSVSNGLQVLGGMGFSAETILQQYYRDIRIMAIYEGTTGIQSLDLLGRKATIKRGKAMKLLMGEIMQSIQAALTFSELKPYAKILGDNLKRNQEILEFLMPFAMKGQYERFLSDATLYMEFLSTVVVAWQWLKMATAAKEALVKGDTTYTKAFYESKIHTMKFYYKYEVPKTIGLAQSLMDNEVLTLLGETELIH